MKTLSNTLDWIDSIEAGTVILIIVGIITVFMVVHAVQQWNLNKKRENEMIWRRKK